MFGFIKRTFIALITFVGCGALISSNLLKRVSMSHQEFSVRSAIVSINSNEPLFYPYIVTLNEFSGNCNNIINLYTKLRAPDVIKNMNIKVFNLLFRANEMSYVLA